MRELRPTIVALHRARADPLRIAAVHSVVVDALTRRLIDLAIADVGPLEVPFAWLALGSVARREATPGSDVESAIALQGDAPGEELIEHALAISRRVETGLRRLRPDARREGHDGGQPAARPLAGLLAARRAQLARGPDSGAGADPRLRRRRQSARCGGSAPGCPSPRPSAPRARHPALLHRLARFSLSYRPPTGFLRGLVVEHSGEHRGRLDLKLGGLVPDRRPRALGGDGRRGHECLDARAPARRGRGRGRCRRPTPPR